MDIIRIILIASAFFFSINAHAYEERFYTPSGYVSGYFPTPEPICIQHEATLNNSGSNFAPYTYSGIQNFNFSTLKCLISDKNAGDAGISVIRQYRCTNGTGTWLTNNTQPACYLPPPPPCTEKLGQVTSYFSTSSDFKTCKEGCEVERNSGACGFNSSGQQGCFMIGTYNGQSCSGDPLAVPQNPEQPPQNTPEFECAAQGMSWGSVNGTIVCVPPATKGGSPLEIHNPATKETTTPAPTPENPSPTPVTNDTPAPIIKIGQDPNGNPIIEKITENPDGSQTKEEQTKGQFCEENPNAQICKNTSFVGSCNGDTFAGACDGDAVQCAIAQKIHEQNCKFFQESPELTNLFNEAKNENDIANPANEANIETLSLPASLTATSPYSGQCIQDLTISFNGSSVTLPFGEWCPILEALGWLMLACAYISAAIILGGAL